MNQSEHQEMSRILNLIQRLEILKVWLRKDNRKTLSRRIESWTTIFREADKQLVAFRQTEEPQAEQIPSEGTSHKN